MPPDTTSERTTANIMTDSLQILNDFFEGMQ